MWTASCRWNLATCRTSVVTERCAGCTGILPAVGGAPCSGEGEDARRTAPRRRRYGQGTIYVRSVPGLCSLEQVKVPPRLLYVAGNLFPQRVHGWELDLVA